MSLKRSQTAPLPISGLSNSSIPRSSSYQQLSVRNVKAHRPKPLVNVHAYSSTPAALSPHLDREDPFSLSGFFPGSAFGVLEEEEEWNWLKKNEEGDVHDDEDDALSNYYLDMSHDESMPETPLSAIFGPEDDEAAATAIRGEDKLGVLMLENVFTSSNMKSHYQDERLFSPYLSDDPVDHDSLCQAVRARRHAHDTLTRGKSNDPVSFGELFLPLGEDVTAVDGGYVGNFLHGMISWLG